MQTCSLQVSKDQAELVNNLFRQKHLTKGFLVYDPPKIKGEIAFIQSGKDPGQRHLIAHVKSEEDWNRLFPSLATGRGDLMLVTEEGEIGEVNQELAQKVFWVLENAHVFEHLAAQPRVL